jgi:hypothetical protein
VRDRVREPGRAGRGVIEELGVRRRGARRVSPEEEEAEAYVVVVLESVLEFGYILRRLSLEAVRRVLPAEELGICR